MIVTVDRNHTNPILKVFLCQKTRDFLIVNLTDIDFELSRHYFINLDNSIYTLSSVLVPLDNINSIYQWEDTINDNNEFFDLDFPDEETALYFKMKYCSD